MKKHLLILLASIVFAGSLTAARFPVLGGLGLIHIQSAKSGSGFGFRSLNAFSNYGDQKFYTVPEANNSFNDLWSYNLLNYSPINNLSLMAIGLAHGEQWSIGSPAGDSLDKTLGCPGDITVAVKYNMPLSNGMIDLAFMPMVSIPMDKDKYQDSPSQTGQLDFGGKLLSDINLSKINILLNVGFFTRGDQRPQLPAGFGLVYSMGNKVSAFLETSAELRMGSKKDSLPDSLILSGRGYDRTEARVTPGIRIVPLKMLGINLAADIRLTKATAPWQIILGFDLPAAAGLIKSVVLPGTIAGLIRHRKTSQPIRGMISFPGTSLPAVVSEPNGNYQLTLNPGIYRIKIMANGFRAIERTLEVKPGESRSWDLDLSPREGTIKGQVSDALTGKPVLALISFDENGDKYYNDQASGAFSFALSAPKKYNISVSADGYQPYQTSFSLTDKEEAVQAISLQPIPKPTPVQPAVVKKSGRTPATNVQSARPERTPAPTAPGLTQKEIDGLYRTGVKQYMSEEYDKAIATFKKILKSDPGNSRAQEYLKKSQDRLKKIRG